MKLFTGLFLVFTLSLTPILTDSVQASYKKAKKKCKKKRKRCEKNPLNKFSGKCKKRYKKCTKKAKKKYKNKPAAKAAPKPTPTPKVQPKVEATAPKPSKAIAPIPTVSEETEYTPGLASNGSFENKTKDWKIKGKGSIDSTHAHSGKSSIKLEDRGNLQFTIPGKDFVVYEVSYWLRAENIKSRKKFVFNPNMDFKKKNGSGGASSGGVRGSTASNNNGKWFRQTAKFKTTGKMKKSILKLKWNLKKGEKLWIDDVSLNEIGENTKGKERAKNKNKPVAALVSVNIPKGENYIKNPSFDRGQSNWEKHKRRKGKFSFDKADKKDGKQSLVLGKGKGQLSQPMNVKQNAVYEASFWIKTNDAKLRSKPRINLTMYKMNGISGAPMMVLKGGVAKEVKKGDWVKITREIKTNNKITGKGKFEINWRLKGDTYYKIDGMSLIEK